MTIFCKTKQILLLFEAPYIFTSWRIIGEDTVSFPLFGLTIVKEHLCLITWRVLLKQYLSEFLPRNPFVLHDSNISQNAQPKDAKDHPQDEFKKFCIWNTRSRDLLRPPFAKTTKYQGSFRINGARTYNTLPRIIRQVETLSEFKIKLKRHFKQ